MWKDAAFQLVYENTVVTLIKSSCVVQSLTLYSTPARRELSDIKSLDITKGSTTVTFVLRSFLAISGVRDALAGNKVSTLLKEAGYNVTAKDPILINIAPTASPTKSQPNASMISAISVGLAAFVILSMGLFYYYRRLKKVKFPLNVDYKVE